MDMKSRRSSKDAKPQGDEGEGTLDRKDLRLTAKALAESWPVPAKLRTKVVRSLEAVLENPEASPRDISMASKALIQASRVNLQAVAVAIAADDHENCKARMDAIEASTERDKNRGRR